MARSITTEAIESKTRVWGGIEIFDFFFLLIFMAMNFVFRNNVHPKLQAPFLIFAAAMGFFLTTKAGKIRRNFERIYFLMVRDVSTYRPFQGDFQGEEGENIDE